MTFMERLALMRGQKTGSVGRMTMPSFLPPLGYSPSARSRSASTVEYLDGRSWPTSSIGTETSPSALQMSSILFIHHTLPAQHMRQLDPIRALDGLDLPHSLNACEFPQCHMPPCQSTVFRPRNRTSFRFQLPFSVIHSCICSFKYLAVTIIFSRSECGKAAGNNC